MEAGAALAGSDGDRSLAELANVVERWTEGGALEIRILEQTDERFSFDVTSCRYAEMYRALGYGEYGRVLWCNRDFGPIRGINPSVVLTRTQTIMAGADHCDFRFGMKKSP